MKDAKSHPYLVKFLCKLKPNRQPHTTCRAAEEDLTVTNKCPPCSGSAVAATLSCFVTVVLLLQTSVISSGRSDG
eukprot:4763065-Pleurochrysis_carterae.AAC.3